MAKGGIKATITKSSLTNVLKAVRFFSKQKNEQIKNEIRLTALLIESDAKQLCPVDTGRLRSSIAADISSDGLSATIGTDVEYAAAIEFGTVAHTIRPVNGKALHFNGKFFAVVHHPGTKARPFLYPAIEQNRQAFLQRIKKIFF